MDGKELRFRVTCALRKAGGRLRSALVPARWDRGGLASRLARDIAGSEALSQARDALRQRDWSAAHRAFAAHFAARSSRFPLDPGALDALGIRVTGRFPDAAADATGRAEQVLAGRYDVLGYNDLSFGNPPAWHKDPVHNREAPFAYWSEVPYLDPESGDHKIIWEINRHQHWLALARAFHLTQDRRYYAAFVEQLEDWIASNPPEQGVNWASMLELGFRSLSWLWSLHFFARAALDDPADSPAWIVDLLLALDRQLTHVEHNLSRYFSPNTHLSGEALALYVAGSALPELADSRRRAALGRQVLLEEIERQIHPDGGHAELSAHYHRYSTDFYLLAALTARVTRDPAAPAFEQAALRQATFLRTLADDEGRLPLLGDDDGGQLFPICGRAPSDCRDTLAAASAILNQPALAVSDIPEEVFWLCGTLPLEQMPRSRTSWASAALPESGYYVSRTPAGDHLVFDAGRHGFLNGGHAHADALSMVLTVQGRPLLVDPGTATYTMHPAVRDRFRTTAMHNTVVLDGRSQSKPGGPFRWDSIADARSLVWRSGPGFDYAEGLHDGYRPVAHVRSVLALHGIGWVVIDHLLGPADREVRADAFWHLHPSWSAVAHGPRTVTLRHRDGVALALASSSALSVLSPASAEGLDGYAPVYGRIERAVCVRSGSTGPVPRSFATFIPAIASSAESAREVSVEPAHLSKSAGPLWHAVAFRISSPGFQAIVLAAIERSPDSAPTSGPGHLWGCEEARTDGRIAVILPGATAPEPWPIFPLASSVHA